MIDSVKKERSEFRMRGTALLTVISDFLLGTTEECVQ
jgi:hypothetical protein